MAQTIQQPDSIQKVIETTKDDSLKAHLINKLAFHYIFNDIEKAESLIFEGIQFAKSKKLIHGEAQLLNTKGIYFDIQGIKDSALYYFDKTLSLCQENDFLDIETMILNNLGMFHWGSANFDLAISYFYQALELKNEHFPNDLDGKATYENNIGLIYQELRQYDKAIIHHKKSLSIRDSLNLLSEQAISLANLGVCYFKKNQFEDAINNYQSAIKFAKEGENWKLYYTVHGNLGNVYNEIGNNDLALENYKKSIDSLGLLYNTPKSILSSYSNLSHIYKKINKPKLAIQYAEKGLQLLEEHPYLLNFSSELHFVYAEINYMFGNIEIGSEYMNIYKDIQDTVFSEKNASALAEIEEKYESAQKDILILEQQKALQFKDLNIQKRSIWFISSLSLAVILLGILFYLYKRKELDAQKANLELKLAEEKEQSRLQHERLRISRELHDNIGSYLTLMSANIDKYSNENKEEDKLRQLKNTLSMSIRELRKTVWLLNKKAISIEELILRLRDFFKPIQSNIVKLNIEAMGNVEKNLSEIQATHLFRIIQEAINNALKYAECTQIDLQFEIKNDEIFYFVISDNGKGYDKDLIEKGNGLENIKLRIKELGGKLKISSRIGKGTIIEGNFKLKNTHISVLNKL